MRVRELRDTNVMVIERSGLHPYDERYFLEDLLALDEAGEHIPILDEDASDFLLYDDRYKPVTISATFASNNTKVENNAEEKE